jgi:hypothetical protein
MFPDCGEIKRQINEEHGEKRAPNPSKEWYFQVVQIK